MPKNIRVNNVVNFSFSTTLLNVKANRGKKNISFSRSQLTFLSVPIRLVIVISLPRSFAAAARLLAAVIAPLTTQLDEITQPSAVRSWWRVAVPNLLFGALTRSRTRGGTPGGPQTTAITAIQTSRVTSVIARRYEFC